VLKANRSNGGLGVWKVTPGGADASRSTSVRVQHAAPRDEHTDVMSVDEFMGQRDDCFVDGGSLVDQPFVPRVAEGIIRAYLVIGEVVGFARQQPDSAAATGPGHNVLGLPSAKTMFPADAPEFGRLRDRLEHEWVPDMCDALDFPAADLPLLWDADFLLGPKTPRGDDVYLLCEINASSVLPFPDGVPAALARAVEARLRAT
jgi:hypothetical protein